MNRFTSSRALGFLKHASTLKHAQVILNVPRGVRPFGLHSPSRTCYSQIDSPSLLRTNSSLANSTPEEEPDFSSLASVSEEDIFTLDESLAVPIKEDELWVKMRVSATTGNTARFGKMWLRENCQCSECIHPATKQRIVNTFALPEKPKVEQIENRRSYVRVKWADGHRGIYPYGFLNNYSPKRINRKLQGAPIRVREYKSYHPIRHAKYPTVAYSKVMSKDNDDELLTWLQHIHDWGFCFVEGIPVNPEATEALLKRIAFIRNTHYGGFWDFTADLTFKDTAYTNEFLGAHTDNTYFTDPARLQLFHLLSHTDGEGGASLLVDGFRAAEILQEENPRHALALMSSKHPYHASGNEDICIQPAEHYPVFKSHQFLRQIYQIRWNNYDRAPKRDWWIDEQNRWYEAARHFDEIIRRPDMEIWTKLKPGTALIFDNWRMMHGRSQFTGKRRMCGGYINNDDFISRLRLLKYGRSVVLNHLGDTTRHPGNPNSII